MTLLAPAALYGWLKTPRSQAFFLGFWVAVLWFWWVGLSFRFTDYPLLAPLAVVFFAVGYGAIFYAVSWLPVWGRALAIGAGFWVVEPFGFVWFKPELLLVNSYYSPHLWALLFVMAACLAWFYLKGWRQIAAVPFLLLAIALPSPEAPPPPPLKIKLVQGALEQSIKWDSAYRTLHAQNALDEIDLAIAQGYELVILPEAVFPLFLNRDPGLIDALVERSARIAVIAGGLHLKAGNLPYNSTYFFSEGRWQVADKVYLVPFGEGNPLPSWMGRWINELFFEGAEDYRTAEGPTDFEINGVKFRNAVCYEGTVEAMFKNAPPYMAVLSNNGWFTPSIEPDLQRLLMRLYAKRYGVRIYHAANQSPSEIIF